MSENKIATKADLQRMYNKMLPYLGGMPEMVANKFSKSDLYSTEEKMIGQWIDGKPLYQKTVDFGALPNKTIKEVAHNVTNIDKILFINGFAVSSSNEQTAPLSFPLDDEAGGVMIAVTKTNVKILCRLKDYSSAYPNTYITFQYTKTTDSPISIGSDTDYSTEEKIIGTWIDGKPIYQKTFTGGKTKSGSSIVSNKIYDFTSLSISTVVDFFGCIANSLPLNIDRQDGTYKVSTYCNTDGAFNKVSSDSWNNLDVVLTLRYTKTTD